MREHLGTLRQKPIERNQTQASDEFVRPTPIIPARDALELHRANSGANPMVEEPELGSDLHQFADAKHFCAWLGLAPKHDISGGKVLNNKTLKTKNRAGQAFRMAAQSVKKADCPFGALYRRLRSRLGPAQATVATAHAIARVVYKMLKHKVEYDPLSVNEYQKKYEEQQACAELVEA